MGVVEGGSRRVFAAAHCGGRPGWLEQPILVDGGGACCFSAEYAPARDRIKRLSEKASR